MTSEVSDRTWVWRGPGCGGKSSSRVHAYFACSVLTDLQSLNKANSPGKGAHSTVTPEIIP